MLYKMLMPCFLVVVEGDGKNAVDGFFSAAAAEHRTQTDWHSHNIYFLYFWNIVNTIQQMETLQEMEIKLMQNMAKQRRMQQNKKSTDLTLECVSPAVKWFCQSSLRPNRRLEDTGRHLFYCNDLLTSI